MTAGVESERTWSFDRCTPQKGGGETVLPPPDPWKKDKFGNLFHNFANKF
jgi:hypothetical protein